MAHELDQAVSELWQAYNLVRGGYVRLSTVRPLHGVLAAQCEALDALETALDLIQEMSRAHANQRL